MQTEEILNEVKKTPKRTYFNAEGDPSTLSANQLYNQYTAFCTASNKTPLGFADWLAWAQQNGLISADGSKKRIKSADGKRFSADSTAETASTGASAAATTEQPAKTATPSTTPVPEVKPTETKTVAKTSSLMEKIKANPGKAVAGLILFVAAVSIIGTIIKHHKKTE